MSETKAQFDKRTDGVDQRVPVPENDVAQPHPLQKEAMDMFAKIMSNRRSSVSMSIAGTAAQLSQLTTAATQVTRFPEVLFVEHFLPLFAGTVQPTEEVNYGTWIAKVSGAEDMPVDIVNDKDEVLFTVPPLLDRSVLEQSKPGGESMTLIERHYSRLKEFDVNASQIFLQKKLSGLHLKNEPTQEVFNNIRTWNDIFTRYGMEDKILALGDILNRDPNKDAPRQSVAGAPETSSDLSDYHLDTD